MTYAPFPPPSSLQGLLRAPGRIWLATHVHPDPDGMGSLLGLGLALQRAGFDVAMLRQEGAPERFEQLPGYELTVEPEAAGPAPDVIVLLDCHEISRIGKTAQLLSEDTIVAIVDHHVATHDSNPYAWIETAAPATTCLVHSLVASLPELSFDARVAHCLYAGLLTDTGGFRFSNTSAVALRVGADLVEQGADASGLAEEMLHRQTPGSLQLLSGVLAGIEYLEEGQVAFLRLTRDLLETTGAASDDAEGFVNFATAVEGVALVAMFREEDGDTWRLSLRANGDHDVQSIAKQFGGGGHRKAAGCSLEGPFARVREQLLNAMRAALNGRSA